MNIRDRFDIPDSVRRVINIAVRHDILDAVDFYAMATEHEADWDKLVAQICDVAYANIHSNNAGHKATVKAAEGFWTWRRLQQAH